jgi:hypothetical protein
LQSIACVAGQIDQPTLSFINAKFAVAPNTGTVGISDWIRVGTLNDKNLHFKTPAKNQTAWYLSE